MCFGFLSYYPANPLMQFCVNFGELDACLFPNGIKTDPETIDVFEGCNMTYFAEVGIQRLAAQLFMR